jgi:hypothetical protein
MFEAEIDFAGGDVLTRVPNSNLGKQINGAPEGMIIRAFVGRC